MGQRVAENIAAIDRLAEEIMILSCDAGTAKIYGRIENQLRQAGHPIPENDIWIGAITLQHGLRLITQDEHFTYIPQLTTSTWIEANSR